MIPNPTFNVVAPPGAQELEFKLKNPSCQVDYEAYAGDLTWALMSSDGTGPFDYDPPGRVEARAHELLGSHVGWRTNDGVGVGLGEDA